MALKIHYIILVILNILDIVTTVTFLEFGIAAEGNPLMAWLLSHGGYVYMAAPKVVFLALFAWLLIKHADELDNSKVALHGMRLMNVVYMFVVALNLSVIVPYFLG